MLLQGNVACVGHVPGGGLAARSCVCDRVVWGNVLRESCERATMLSVKELRVAREANLDQQECGSLDMPSGRT